MIITKEQYQALPENLRGCFRRVGYNSHPTVKPIKLFSWLIAIGSRPGDVVLDPFCGSGTACISAAIADRRYIGIDLDDYNCDISRKRIAWHVEQMQEEQPELALVAD